MKKNLIVLFVSILALLTLFFTIDTKINAAEPTAAGKVVFHYQLWDGDYSSSGLWTWGTGTGGTSSAVTSTVTDAFGGVYEINVMSDADDEIGLIPLRKDITLDSRWDSRETPDGYHIKFNVTALKNGTVNELHVYYFQGGYQTYYLADPAKVNVIVLYYDPSGTYEDNLGVHAWNGWENFTEPSWGTPAKVFSDGFKSPGNVQGKAALLQFTPDGTKDPGFLIYAGSDQTKKHASAGDIKGFKDLKAGAVKVVYVSGGSVYDGVDKRQTFVDNAFTFDFIPFALATLDGTYAKDPRVIFVKTSIAVTTKEKTGEETYYVNEVIGQKIEVVPSEDGWKLPTDLPEYPAYKATALPANVKGRVVFHYQKWDGNYTGTGLWTWNAGTDGTKDGVAMTGVDAFGAVMEINIDDDAADTIGIIPIGAEIGSDARWNHRETPDGQHINFDVTAIKAGTATTIHVYYFQGGFQTYYVADPAKANVLVLYFDKTGTYEENLGVHAWNGWENFTETDWGTPAKVFKDGFKSPDNVQGKAALLQFTPDGTKDPGLLIYAGDDATKKHPSGNLDGFKTMTAGQVKLVYVTVETIFQSRIDFAPVAFGGEVIFTDVYGDVAYVRDVMGLIDLKTYFTLKQGTTVVPIAQIDYNTTADSTNEFVIQLAEANALNNTKAYTLHFNNGLTGDKQLLAEIALDLDKEKPVIALVDPDAAITVALGAKWDQSLFPVYRVTDNRDANLTPKVYVAKGHGTLDTNKVGDYPIRLEVVDEWGNVGQLDFTITVVAPEKGCKANSASAMVGFGLLGLVFFFRRRRYA
ncbi:MAG TPA: pullulanase-associated domain-containing protein [Bacilli bacterium]|nr:MAG: Bacterial pullanase-associated domain protein [Tenericutes bacterium ADurb.BinA124]HOH17897.1 pullulanase-associated domain-containing protein [Bacilli bacterium]HPX83829.1 pullulanase-associated domain-containing protein [Bacilli bacterium]HQC74707.1 pullulanase-associated domain-containing protein [Bacilli bacterium]